MLRRIVESAEGNPLYVEQIVSMLVEDGTLRAEDGRWVATTVSDIRVPATIQALLAARLDLLDSAERSVIEAASVIGQRFARAAVQELVPEWVAEQLQSRLASLATKDLVRREPAGDDDMYRFQHILIRDAAYGSLLKRTRATLHERFVEWAERVNRDRERSREY